MMSSSSSSSSSTDAAGANISSLQSPPSSSLTELFESVADRVRTSSSLQNEDSKVAGRSVSNETKLALYALYKQATTSGRFDCAEPPLWNPVARAKYHAWSRVQQLNPAQAMQRYIALVAQQQDHALGRTVHQEYQAWLQQQPQPQPPPQQEENNSDTTLCTVLSTHDSPTLQLQQQLLLWWNQVAILPRGRLDISAFQLAQTALNCVLNGLWNRKDARDLEQLIAQHYTTNTLNNHTNVLVGLSVRSLLDLYLRCRNFTPRSTVLMAPPINIPSILTIFQKHGLQVVGVDLKSTQEMRINVHPLQDLLQQHSNVVALLLVHPFGMRSVTPDDMQVLLQASQKHHFDILEDCAECHGLHPTPSATMSFFSFGMTKTATALGGGVAILHQDEDVAQAMQRMHTTLYPRQSHARYLRKVLQAMLVQCVTASPILYGMLVTIVGTDRWNDFATTWTRNLSLQFGWHDLRQRPCRALLQTLVAQLQRPPDTRKARRAHEVAQHLTPVMPPDASSWWLTPILISTKPHTVAQCLLQYHGMDVPQGNLQCLCNHCPHAQQMMEQVLYVPDNAWSVPKVAQTILAATRHQQERTPTTRTTWSNQTILMGLVALVCTCGSSLCRMLLWLWIQAAIVLLLGKLTFNVGLMLSVGNLYLESSQTFAKYNPMLRQAFEHSSEANPSNLLNSTIPAPKLDNTTNSNGTNKYCVVLTGATGFLGTCILYELLRHCTLEKIIVICRSKKGKTASQRIQDLLHQDMFSLVSDRKRLIMVMEGDTLKPNAGLDSQDLHRLRHDFKVRCVINCAATVAFTQSLEDAAESNITSALYLQKLSRTLKARLVQISTAFVHGGLTGEPSSPLPQTLFSLESFDPRRIYKSMLGNQMFASLAMSTLGFPNTYTFSKCVCEHLLLDGGANDTVIIRPSIIGPALEEPYEGWAGLRPSTIVAATCLYLKYPFCVWCFGNHVAPIIPVDVVARFVVAKSLMNVEESSTTCASGYSSPATSDYDKLSSLEEVDSLSTGSCTTETTAPASVGKAINSVYNVVWNNDSPTSSTFSWVDFATSVPHLGTVLGYISRSTAYLGYLVSLKILPSLHLSPRKFSALYHVFVQVPFQWLLKVLVFFGQRDMHQQLSKLYQFLDLPVLFYPFSNNSFYFESELVAPEGLLGERYLFSCVAAAHRFLYDWIAATEGVGIHRKNVPVRDSSVVLIGGQHHTMVTSDLFWALSQPKGNILVRLSGFLFIKLLRASSSGVSVDVESFSEISRSLSDTDARDVHIILAPTHRSLFDFILVSFIIFSLPELQIHMPFVAAAEEFSELPYFGWLLDYLNAFFITRGRGADPQLSTTIKRIKETSGGRGICIEVFIEGTRSRDRRFLKPKTGFLRCLAQTGGEHLIVPICISYEKIPEQDSLIRESISGTKRPVNTGGLLAWLWKTLQGKEPIGNIHVSASNPISFPGGEAKVNSIAKLVQLRQKDMVKISGYHLRCAERVLDVKQDVIERALLELGCELWNSMCVSNVAEEVPYGSDAWVATLQFAHVVSPALRHTHPQWAEWLCQVEYSAFISDSVSANKSVLTLVKAFQNLFERAEARVDAAIEELRGKSVGTLTSYHVFQIAVENQEDESVPETLLLACSKMKVRDNELPRKLSKIEPSLIDPYVGNEFEELGMWGFKDSRFQVRPDAKGRPTVVLSGSRYELSGKNLTRLIPFIEQETKITIDFLREPPLDVMGLAIDDCGIAEDEVEELCGIVSEISVASSVRIRHGTGHSQEEAYQLRNCDSVRVPDVVVWPCSEHEVEKVVQKAKDLSWNLIPHGGGTNVSHATKCPSREADPRPIISVDMTRLNRIIWVKEEDGLAHVQAGITGKDLMEELKHRGYTIGHEPDSLEFSTLGGWIATKASGMKRSKYGNIEDIVVDIRVVGSNGLLWQGKNDEDTFFHPERESRGTGLLSLFVGSEGCLGIITSAVVRIFPLPLVQEHESILLTDFDTGSKFVYSVSRLGSFVPASVRLLDNAHFRLGLAMRETDSVSDYLRNLALRFLKPSFNSFSSNDVVCVTVVFEGSEVEVRQQRLQIRGLTEQYGGMLLGPGIGRAGYNLTFSIAYLRDFALSYNFLGDSFETFTPWSKLQQIVSSTKSRIKEEHKKRRLPGEVFVGCRVTQLYHSGACLYFYFCMFCGNVMNASKVFSEIEDEARREILRNGGSLSHHHGIGKIRSRYLRDMDSEGCRQALISLKKATDPSDVFGARNGVFGAHIDR